MIIRVSVARNWHVITSEGNLPSEIRSHFGVVDSMSLEIPVSRRSMWRVNSHKDFYILDFCRLAESRLETLKILTSFRLFKNTTLAGAFDRYLSD